MTLKNTIKFILIIPIFFLLSCETIDNFKNNKEEILPLSHEKIEKNEKFDNSIVNNIYFYDFYSSPVNYSWNSNKKINKIFSTKIKKNKIVESNSLTSFIVNNTVYVIDFESNLIIYSIETEKKLQTYSIKKNLDNDFSYPTSVAMLDNQFYLSYSDGYIINTNIKGEIIWSNSFNDILKTPIMIHNKNLIVLLSNRIVSIDINDGKIIWDFEYNNDVPLNSTGGSILSNNNLLFFLLPNKRIGQIDTIIGEKIDSSFSNIKFNDTLLNYNYSYHFFKNTISFFENNKYLTSIDMNTNDYLFKKFIIPNVYSHHYINNILLTLDIENNLRAFNISNNNIFWKINLSDYISKENNIIEIVNNESNLVIFFKNGLILEINYLTGEIINDIDLNINHINKIDFYNQYLIVYQNNGKFSIFIQ